MTATFTTGSARASTNVSGHITTDTEWTTAGSPYILTGTLWVDSGVTLTIDAGVYVLFNSEFRQMYVDGTILADGTSGSPVVIDSQAHYNGSSCSSDANQWWNLNIQSGNNASTFTYTDIYCGGWGSAPQSSGAISITGGTTVYIDNSVFEDNANSAIVVGNGATSGPWPKVVLNEDTIGANGDPNGQGISVNQGALAADSTNIDYNTHRGVFLNITSTYTGSNAEASSFNDGTIEHNGNIGFDFQAPSGMNLTYAAHGTNNTIGYNNALWQLATNNQFLGTSVPNATVDWTGNTWFSPTGASMSPQDNDSTCTGAGYPAHYAWFPSDSSNLPVPDHVQEITTGTYPNYEYHYCYYDYVNAVNP